MEQKSCTSSRLCGKVERWKGAKKWRKYSDKVPELTLVACFGLFFNFFFNFVSILFPFVFIFTSPLFSLVTLSPFSPFSSQKCLNTNQARFILLHEPIANAISRFFLFYLSWFFALFCIFFLDVSLHLFKRVLPLPFIYRTSPGGLYDASRRLKSSFSAFFLNGNGHTDEHMDIRTDRPSYRDARTHLKKTK